LWSYNAESITVGPHRARKSLGNSDNSEAAFAALHAMGFTHLRVLAQPDNFNADWFEKGFPTEKGM